MKKLQKICVLLSLGLPLSGAIQADDNVYVSTRTLTADMANRISMAAYKECTKKGYHVAAAVVGKDGRLLSFTRSPLAGAHTIKVARDKAYTSMTFSTATSRLVGMEFMRDIPDVLTDIGGGLVVSAGGHNYGALGVSGAPASKKPGDIDEECAKAGIAAVIDDLEMAD